MNAPATGRVFGYSRVSRDDLTTENQRIEIERAGYTVPSHRFLSDTASGLIPALRRPAFAKLVDRLEPGDTVVVSRLDRLGRDALDVEATLRLLESRGVAVICLQIGSTDLNSSAGMLIRRILAAVAAMERDVLAERTRAGLARAKSQGRTLGRPSKTTPTQQATIRQRAAGGASISSLARQYGISRSTVLDLIRKGATH